LNTAGVAKKLPTQFDVRRKLAPSSSTTPTLAPFTPMGPAWEGGTEAEENTVPAIANTV
jgi:hypothetical protein